MKKVIIEGKEYWQQEDCDIPKIPMPIDKDILKNHDQNLCEHSWFKTRTSPMQCTKCLKIK